MTHFNRLHLYNQIHIEISSLKFYIYIRMIETWAQKKNDHQVLTDRSVAERVVSWRIEWFAQSLFANIGNFLCRNQLRIRILWPDKGKKVNSAVCKVDTPQDLFLSVRYLIVQEANIDILIFIRRLCIKYFVVYLMKILSLNLSDQIENKESLIAESDWISNKRLISVSMK